MCYGVWGQEKFETNNVPFRWVQKAEIKQMAKMPDLLILANKSESYDICFVA